MSAKTLERPAPAQDQRLLAATGSLIAGALAAGFLIWSNVAAAAEAPQSFSKLVERVSPAVVNIAMERNVETPNASGEMPFNFPPGSPFEEFFKQFQDRFGNPGGTPQEQRQRGVGSGFIIDPDGLVVTNNHVVEEADKVEVNLSDGRSFPAEIVGTDPQTDLALLKIETDEALPFVQFGDSDTAKVGDWVLAVGNPFNLGGTVTAGIVSARGRDINAGPYVDFIQSDAAINRGNSGGPMFNVDGQVIGVNTAIFSPNGGSIGIGFAIPSNMAKSVVADLKEHGSVERGWLGVSIQQVTPELADGLGLKEPTGALVAKVLPDSPASEVDIQAGDVIVGFNGQPVKEMRELPRLVAGVRAGSTADVELWRNGEERTVQVKIAKQTEDRMAAARGTPSKPDAGASAVLGAKLATLDGDMRQELGLDDGIEGVVITDLSVSGQAAEQGLRVGDVIEQVGGEAVRSPKEVDSRLEAARKAEKSAVVMLVNRRGNTLFVGMPLKKS